GLAPPHQDEVRAVFAGRQDRAGDRVGGSEVPSHRVDGDSNLQSRALPGCACLSASNPAQSAARNAGRRTGRRGRDGRLPVASGLADLDDFPPLVVAAMRTDPVRQLRLVAIRALRKDGTGQSVVGTPLVAARARMTSFGIRHRLVLKVTLEEALEDPEARILGPLLRAGTGPRVQ